MSQFNEILIVILTVNSFGMSGLPNIEQKAIIYYLPGQSLSLQI